MTDNFNNDNNKNSAKRNIKIGIAVLVVVLLATSLVFAGIKFTTHSRLKKIEQNATEWKENAVTTPTAGSLKAAGYITITWNSAEDLGEVSGYRVYVDDTLVEETNNKTTTCEYYTTEVSSHQVYVEADLKHGSKINSNIFTFYVNKKGFCVNKDMAQNLDAVEWGVSWYYNWAFEPLKYTTFRELDYVPMMWTSYDTDQKTISRFSKFGYKYILAFNEPDLAEQSNIDVDTAVEGMKAFMNQNLYVGSPATALCPPWSDKWFQPFMEKMESENMDVDFIAIHHYWNWFQKEGADAFIDLIKETYEMYNKPIWITEFAISGDPGKTEEQRQKVIDYMNMVIPELDKLDYVERYAWFSFNPDDKKNGASSLIQYYEGTITDLGYLYQELGMPEGYGDEDAVCNVENPKADIIK
jgi:hypothetical protein